MVYRLYNYYMVWNKNRIFAHNNLKTQQKFQMKKTMEKLAMLALCVAMSVSLAACSDDNNDDTSGGEVVNPNPTEAPEFTTNLLSEGQYRGDYYDSETGNILVGISDKSIVYDAEKKKYVGNGKMIAISFNTAIAEDPDFATLVQGKYTGNNTHAKGSITLGGETYVVTYRDGNATKTTVTKGNITVTAYGDGVYAIEGSLVTAGGATKVDYVGKIPMYNRSFSGTMSNLTAGVQVTGFKQAAIINHGTYYSDQSEYIMVGLAGDDYTLLENVGNGQCVWFSLNVSLGSVGIPSGTYSLLNSAEMDEDDDFDPFTAIDGFYYPPLDGFYGSWYYHTGAGVEAAIKTGNITVTNKGNNLYSISFNVKDGHGNPITGSYEGTFVYIDNK